MGFDFQNRQRPDTAREYRMESSLILAEMPDPRSVDLLKGLLKDTSNDSELRAAGAWGLADISTDTESAGLVAQDYGVERVLPVVPVLRLASGGISLETPKPRPKFVGVSGITTGRAMTPDSRAVYDL